MRMMLTLSASLAVLAACAPETEQPAQEPAEEAAPEQAAEAAPEDATPGDVMAGDAEPVEAEGDTMAEEMAAPAWGYEGELAPANWDDLSEAWAVCETGTEQSPIDFAGMEGGEAVTPVLDWTVAEAADIVDNGHTIQANLTNAGSLTLDGTEYELVQFHFHAASEHTVEGEQYPLEVHFVHASEDGRLAVVGVFFEEGEAEPGLDPVWNNLPQAQGHIPVGAIVDPAEFLPEDLTAWRYPGSLTTPPCSEGVAWTVLQTPITASAEQIAAYTARYDNNYRPVQPLGDRTVNVGEVTLE